MNFSLVTRAAAPSSSSRYRTRFRAQGVTYLRIYRRVISRDFREKAFSERPPYRRINPRRISQTQTEETFAALRATFPRNLATLSVSDNTLSLSLLASLRALLPRNFLVIPSRTASNARRHSKVAKMAQLNPQRQQRARVRQRSSVRSISDHASPSHARTWTRIRNKES